MTRMVSFLSTSTIFYLSLTVYNVSFISILLLHLLCCSCAMLIALMVGWELKPDFLLDEIHSGEKSKFFDVFYRVCIKWLVAPIMAFVLAGQMIDFFPVNPTSIYCIAFGLLAIFFIFTLVGKNKDKV